jgi:hypothetical protein
VESPGVSFLDGFNTIFFGTIVGVPKTLELDPYLIDVLLPDLVGHDRRPASYVLYLWLWAMTHGIGREAAFFSYQMMTDRTGLSRSAAQRAVSWLERRQLLRVRKRTPTAVPEYAVLTPWRR